MRKKISRIILLAGILLTVSGNTRGAGSDSIMKPIVPEGSSFKEKQSPFLYYEVYRNSELIGYCFNTLGSAPGEKGFSGHIGMIVFLDTEGKIRNLKVLSHRETPEYAAGIETDDFLDRFKGKGAGDDFIIGRDVDGITHATISSQAVARILKISIDNMQGILPSSGQKKVADNRIDLNVDFYITACLITVFFAAFYFKIAWIRYMGFLFSIIYFGFLKANFISMTSLGNIFLGRVPDFRMNISWYIFIFSGLILTFLIGGFYCSYMCPFGALQIFLNKVFKFKFKISPLLSKNLKRALYGLLWIFILLALILKNPNMVNYEPFSTVFLMKGDVIAWSIAWIIIAMSLFSYRVFCNYFCAAGAFMSILSTAGRKLFRKK